MAKKKTAVKKSVKKKSAKKAVIKKSAKKAVVKAGVKVRKPSIMPVAGDSAPDFSLPASTGHAINLASFRNNQNVVLYFYPKDDTPGCTMEACSFRDHHGRILATGTAVIGVSPDAIKSHLRFIEKYNLPFPLVADEQNTVATKYGVWVEKSMYGRTYMGIQRATFLIDKTGKIAAAWPKVKVDGHTDEVLAAIQKL